MIWFAFYLRCGHIGEDNIFVYCDTTDAGSDEASRRRKIAAAVAPINNILYLHCNCLLHQAHLAIKDGLETVDKYLHQLSQLHPEVTNGFTRYFSNVGKLSNFWRERVAEFIVLFEKIHGDCGHGVNYRQYPLAVIAGRWGSIHSAEDFLLTRGRAFLEPVLMALLSKYMKAAKQSQNNHDKHDDDVQPAGGDDKKKKKRKRNDSLILDEEQHEYRLKMSKWTGGTLATISNSLFWLQLRLQNTARGPLTHFMNYVQKYSTDKLLMRLVCGTSQQFLDEYRKLIDTFPTWFEQAVEEAKAADLPKFVLDQVRSLTMKLLLSMSSSFNVRIVVPLTRLSGCPVFSMFKF